MNTPIAVSQENKTYANLVEYAQQIKDYRVRAKIDYELWKIVVISICALLAGANNFVEIAQYAEDRKHWLKKYFAVGSKIPSHDTINRVFGMMLPMDFNTCILRWLKGLVSESQIINIDGKVIEGYRSKDPFIILRAWACEIKCILGQIKVPYGTNEITAIPMLLETLRIKDKIITIDAIGAQKKIIQKIAEKEAHYLVALKGNQHAFYQDVKLFLDAIADYELDNFTYTYHETMGKDHGRI